MHGTNHQIHYVRTVTTYTLFSWSQPATNHATFPIFAAASRTRDSDSWTWRINTYRSRPDATRWRFIAPCPNTTPSDTKINERFVSEMVKNLIPTEATFSIPDNSLDVIRTSPAPSSYNLDVFDCMRIMWSWLGEQTQECDDFSSLEY